MKIYSIFFLESLTKNYFQEINDHKIYEFTQTLKNINFENKFKTFDFLKTNILISEISEQFVSQDENINCFNKIENLISKYDIPFYFLLDSLYKDYHKYKKENVIYCSYMLLLTYWLFIKGHNIRAKKWNEQANTGLFLVGKSFRKNRGPLLFKFWQQNLLEKLNWSFYDSQNNYEKIKENIENFKPDDFQNFLKDCVKVLDLDNRLNIINDNQTFSYNSYPVDISLYENTSFSIITETMFRGKPDYPMISEKTYRAIINYHPFIIAGHTGVLKKLESMGFRTYKEYLDHPHYNDIVDDDEKLQLIVENTKTFSENLRKNKQNVLEDIKHNAELLIQYCFNEVNHIKNKLGTDESIIDQIILAHKIS